MKRWTLLTAAGLIACAASTAAPAADQTQYQALKDGGKACAWCDLSGAKLAKFKLSGVDLSGANLTGADLRSADLRNVDFSGADLTGVDVNGADLSGANLTGADIDQVDLSEAVLKGTKLERANCDWATKLPAGSNLSCVGVTIERK
jgi:uncharacterized protein YjbI with pentapeptide repeats